MFIIKFAYVLGSNGGIENFLPQLLKYKIPQYHSILPYNGFYTIISIGYHANVLAMVLIANITVYT